MAYQPRQPCETYFVESNDTSYPPPRAHHEMIKIQGRMKQQAMADELSRQACDAYMDDIVDHMAQMEEKTLPDVASIDIQSEIQWFMRPYLIDFLIEAHAAFQLLEETLFLAVNLLDRYCSRRVVYKRHYQLVGCAALLIAAKYGDKKERVPMIKELKSMCCALYDEEMFTQMEWHVLNTLDWVVGHPTVDTFMQLEMKEVSDDIEVESMALYLSQIALYHKDFVQSKPSVMARVSLALARGILLRPDNMDALDHIENMTMLHLSQKLENPSVVLGRKFATPHMSGVSKKLDDFLVEEARRACPPTPPREPVQIQKTTPNTFPGTPTKQPYGHVVNGYMTPPITPDGEYFVGGQDKGYGVHRFPITPNSQLSIHNNYGYAHAHAQPPPQYPSYQHHDMMQ